MRQSTNKVLDGRLMNGFDYENQAWVLNGKYENCGHQKAGIGPEDFDCNCFGRLHAGEETK